MFSTTNKYSKLTLVFIVLYVIGLLWVGIGTFLPSSFDWLYDFVYRYEYLSDWLERHEDLDDFLFFASENLFVASLYLTIVFMIFAVATGTISLMRLDKTKDKKEWRMMLVFTPITVILLLGYLIFVRLVWLS
ncbi:MAG: hypothetical protein COU90_04045 [Candidatus Ryanbacteria bacterium CG10_big_fil_rev_8_21_14_0_10_43_42]|uniref:Uncharacterized protein n=1 Tax=Candidatus Ryanbacteria bacterium CG10_big_fil_rev_8_21_14_0_10_43_42 TaxID=1974864 RepID=A0A2M8KWJ4_9BACT|nr:MAG: hypothetical protein COU90_04045 [Candidatus Ryanbacteria bacterium CG10_big_fil_rev_8_21_14_0_10_43_42]